MNRKTLPDQRITGFTLIELSIVLVIIALIIGGVIAGRQMIQNAMIRKEIAQIEQLETAINTFRVKYAAIPGDMANSSDFFSNTRDGDGSGYIDGMIGVRGIYADKDSEVTASLHHLASARLINLPDYNLTTFISDGTQRFTPDTHFLSGAYGNGICLVGSTEVHVNAISIGCNNATSPRLSTWPSQLSEVYLVSTIDAKVDDGAPRSGNVQNISGIPPGAAFPSWTDTGGCQNVTYYWRDGQGAFVRPEDCILKILNQF